MRPDIMEELDRKASLKLNPAIDCQRNSRGGRLSRLCGRAGRILLSAGFHLTRVSGLLRFTPRSDDIFVASYPRSGTTWLQMVLYQLTTDGGLDFEHISAVVPYFERSLLTGRNLNLLPAPRVFKTHLSYLEAPKGFGRFIYVARSGRDVLVSNFHFQKTHGGFKGTFDEFFERFLTGQVPGGSWFEHVAEWRANRAHVRVLFLTYEELTTQLETCIRSIAEFCNLPLSPARLATVLERCSFDFMKQHEHKFDFLNEVLWERGFVQGSFIREGKMGSWKEYFSQDQELAFRRVAELHSGGAPAARTRERGGNAETS